MVFDYSKDLSVICKLGNFTARSLLSILTYDLEKAYSAMVLGGTLAQSPLT